jgi:hypothetical protein
VVGSDDLQGHPFLLDLVPCEPDGRKAAGAQLVYNSVLFVVDVARLVGWKPPGTYLSRFSVSPRSTGRKRNHQDAADGDIASPSSEWGDGIAGELQSTVPHTWSSGSSYTAMGC